MVIMFLQSTGNQKPMFKYGRRTFLLIALSLYVQACKRQRKDNQLHRSVSPRLKCILEEVRISKKNLFSILSFCKTKRKKKLEKKKRWERKKRKTKQIIDTNAVFSFFHPKRSDAYVSLQLFKNMHNHICDDQKINVNHSTQCTSEIRLRFSVRCRN